jgi:hypothetical protein
MEILNVSGSAAVCVRAAWTWAKIASVSGIFFGTCFENATQPIAQAVEDATNGLPARDVVVDFGLSFQGVADRFGRDAGVGECGLELGVGLGLGFDDSMNVFGEGRATVLGFLAAAKVAGIEAANAGTPFVESGVDRLASPAENSLGLACRRAALFRRHLSLETPTAISGE